MSNNRLVARITVDPDICHGKPCVRGMRYPVDTILEYLAGADSIDSLLDEFPDLQREDVLACIEFARRTMTAERVHVELPCLAGLGNCYCYQRETYLQGIYAKSSNGIFL